MSSGTSQRSLDVAVAVFAGCGIFAVLGGTVADPDLWGHVRFGQLIRDLGFVPRHDPYAYTEAGRTWINHEWLAEWLFGWTYDVAGTWGLVVLKLSFLMAVFGLAADHLRRRGVGVLLAAIMLLLAALPMRVGFPHLRPHLFTFLLLLATLLVLRASRRRPGVLWLLPPIFALWINAHGGVLAGIGVVGIWFLAERVQEWTSGDLKTADRAEGPAVVTWAAVGVTSAVALLLNPYGVELPRFLLETATVPRPFIQDWAALHLSSAYGIVYLSLLAVGTVLLLLSGGRIRVPEAALLAVGALLPFVAIRHLALFAVVWLVTLADPAASVWSRVRDRPGDSTGETSRWLSMAAVAALLMGTVGLIVDGARDLGCVASSGPTTVEFPRETVGYLAGTRDDYRLAIQFGWGEYAIWHLGPRIQVAMDGRRETVYPDPIYRAYLDFETGRGDWSRHLEDPRADLAIVPKMGPTANLLALDPGWIRWMEGSVGVLFARAPVVASLPPVGEGPPETEDAHAGEERPWCFPA